MIPNMYKIAGELLPCVFHVSARTVASHALNIFGDHSDVYACRQTGFAMLAESNPQEVMDLAPVAHLSAIEGRVPFLNFFDGFRTSHEIQKIEVWDYADLKEMTDMDAVKAFRDHALNPEHPAMRGSHENGDVFFQHREACNKYYDALPEIVEKYMGKINDKLGTNYQLFEYYGAPDADRVIIAMGSICDVAEEVIDYMNAHGEKVGIVKVRLYRPFRADKLLAAVPATAKKIAVLDRTKEPGAYAEPLHLDVMSAFAEAGREATIIGGRYGLGSKDTPPSSVFAVYNELAKDAPKARFTIGITDDVTYLSLPEEPAPTRLRKAPRSASSGAWAATAPSAPTRTPPRSSATHRQVHPGLLPVRLEEDRRRDDQPPALRRQAHQGSVLHQQGRLRGLPQPLLCRQGLQDGQRRQGRRRVHDQLPVERRRAGSPHAAEAKRYIAKHNVQLYTINAIDKAIEIGLGKRTNTILQSAFFALAGVLPREDAIKYMKQAAEKSFAKKGQAIVEMNWKAIDAGFDAYHKVEVPASWADAKDPADDHQMVGNPATVDMVKNLLNPIGKMDGDSLPVSAFEKYVDGQFEQGASAYEKRGVAVTVPEWNADKCIQCNQCAYVCPHATIRPFALTADEAAKAPAALKTKKMNGKGCEDYLFTMAVSPLDCMGCGVCVGVCPAPGKAITMVPQESQLDQQEVFDYCVANIDKKPGMMAETTVKGSQFNQPLLEFSGSCAGCAETSYARLITQLFGERMFISNATGCSSIWAARLPRLRTPATVCPARARPGRTACSRTTPSTASVCTWARRPSATAWSRRPTR